MWPIPYGGGRSNVGGRIEALAERPGRSASVPSNKRGFAHSAT